MTTFSFRHRPERENRLCHVAAPNEVPGNEPKQIDALQKAEAVDGKGKEAAERAENPLDSVKNKRTAAIDRASTDAKDLQQWSQGKEKELASLQQTLSRQQNSDMLVDLAKQAAVPGGVVLPEGKTQVASVERPADDQAAKGTQEVQRKEAAEGASVTEKGRQTLA